MFRITVFTVTLVFLCCELPHKLGSQPVEIIPTNFEPGHNIFGVLRLDDSTNSSFIRIEKAYQNEEISDILSTVVKNAEVIISDDGESYEFLPSVDSQNGLIYKNKQFIPIEGKIYSLSVKSVNLPASTAETVIPSHPVYNNLKINPTENRLSLSIVPSPDIILYEVYIISDNNYITNRYLNDGENLDVEFDLVGLSETPKIVEIYGYDKNLAEYMLSSVTIKPQTYHNLVNTINGGYGCFGALNRTVINID